MVFAQKDAKRRAFWEVVFPGAFGKLKVAGSAGHHPENGQNRLVFFSTADIRRIKKIEFQILCVFLEPPAHGAAVEILSGKLGPVLAATGEDGLNARPCDGGADALFFVSGASGFDALSLKAGG